MEDQEKGRKEGQDNTEATGELRKKAEKRVEERTAMLWHVTVYLVINDFMVFIWAVQGRGYPWFLWVMGPWGVWLAFHVAGYFIGTRGEERRERLVEKEMERIRKEKGE